MRNDQDSLVDADTDNTSIWYRDGVTSRLHLPERYAVGYFIFIAVIYLCFLFPGPEFNTFNKDDSSSFLILGINFADSGVFSADLPGGTLRPHATWPPGFPLFLSVFLRVFGVSWFALKLCMVVLGLLNLLVVSQVLRRSRTGLLVALLTALSPVYFLFSHVLMTEVPFMLLASMVLFLVQAKSSPRMLATAGIIAACAFWVRGYAIAFLPACFMFLITQFDLPLLDRLKRIGCFSVTLVLSVLLWHAYTSAVIEQGTVDTTTQIFGNGTDFAAWKEMDPPGNVITKNLRKFHWYIARLPAYFTLGVLEWETVLQNDVWLIPSLFLLLVALWGWILACRGRRTLLEWFVPCFIFLLFALPGKSNPRYWLLLLPFYYHYLLLGLSSSLRPVSALAHRQILVSAFLAALCSVGLVQHLVQPDPLRFEGAIYKELVDAGVYIKKHGNEDTVVLTSRRLGPHLVYAATQKQCRVVPDIINAFDFPERYYILVPTKTPWDEPNDFSASCFTRVEQGLLRVCWRGDAICILEPHLSVGVTSPHRIAPL
ncbi:glycosyltransferase family 39 protein [bacterium]|nr:glycosyltransferase family 39 protein [bacterium]